MDPRHPELAVTRLKELIEQYDRVEKGMAKATIASELGQLEREGGLVVQEICLVAPRLHEAMMQASRQRRYELSHNVITAYLQPVEMTVASPVGSVTKTVEMYVAPNQAETVIVEPKPRKKKTSKKKKAE